MPKKRNRALAAGDRRNLIQHVLMQKRGKWMTSRALRRFVDARRSVVEQDLKRMADFGVLELSQVEDFNTDLDRCQAVMMARATDT